MEKDQGFKMTGLSREDLIKWWNEQEQSVLFRVYIDTNVDPPGKRDALSRQTKQAEQGRIFGVLQNYLLDNPEMFPSMINQEHQIYLSLGSIVANLTPAEVLLLLQKEEVTTIGEVIVAVKKDLDSNANTGDEFKPPEIVYI